MWRYELGAAGFLALRCRDRRLVIFDEISLGLAPVVLDKLYEALALLRQAGMTLIVIESPPGTFSGRRCGRRRAIGRQFSDGRFSASPKGGFTGTNLISAKSTVRWRRRPRSGASACTCLSAPLGSRLSKPRSRRFRCRNTPTRSIPWSNFCTRSTAPSALRPTLTAVRDGIVRLNSILPAGAPGGVEPRCFCSRIANAFGEIRRRKWPIQFALTVPLRANLPG